MENEFEIIASFTNWLKILPELKSIGYKRLSYYSKGVNITYFKKD